MARTSYRQRKALGRRYGQDPQIELDRAELDAQYRTKMALAPLSEQRKTSILHQQAIDKQAASAEKASMMGTMGNVAGLGLQAYKAGLFDKILPATKSIAPVAGSVTTPVMSGLGITGSALNPSYVTSGIDAGMEAAMAAGADVSGSIVPSAVSGATSGVTSGLSNIAGYASPAGYGMAAKAVVQPLFGEASKTVKNFGGVSEYAGEGINMFLSEPMKENTLEGAGTNMARNVIDKVAGTTDNIMNSWQARTVTDIFDPVGSALDLFKEGIGSLVSSVFGG